MRLCYLAAGTTVTVTVGRNLIARVSGIHRCGSIWACPLCAPVVRQGRAVEIDAAVGRLLAEGGSALFVTATGPHHRGDALKPLFDLTAKFGEHTLRGARAKELRDTLGHVGTIRALEVTYTENGWHPHVHSVLCFDRKLTPADVAVLRTYLFRRWQIALTRRGFGKLHPVHGVDVRPVYDSAGLSEYVAALEGGWGVGLELARSDLKHRSATPMELLSDWATGADLVARELWREYERATFGRRCIQWTPGLRKRLLAESVDTTDEELAAAEGEDEVLVSVEVDGRTWDVYVRAGQVGRVLRDIEEMAALFIVLAGLFGPERESANAR